MKNSMNITLGNINLVIEGQPVVLENIQLNYENEASVQELAAGASFVKDLVSEIKTLIKDAQTTANATTKAITKEELPNGTFDDQDLVKKTSKKPSQKWDLFAIWEVMTSSLPEGFVKNGIGSYVYKYERENDNGKKEKITIKLSFQEDSIDMRIYVGSNVSSFYLYEDPKSSWFDGIHKCLIEDLLNALPADVREFVRIFVKKVLAN